MGCRNALLGVGAVLLVALLAGCTFLGIGPDNSLTMAVRGHAELEGEANHSGITVRISYYDSYWGTVVTATTATGPNGAFVMPKVPVIYGQAEYSIIAYKDGYARADDSVGVYYGYDGTPFVYDFLLRVGKVMTFEWRYSETGDFSGSTTTSSVCSDVHGAGHVYGFDFDSGRNSTSYSSREFLFYHDDDYTHEIVLNYARLWDMGDVPIASVTEVPERSEDDYSGSPRMQVGHTYVIRCDSGYAVFRVLDISDAT